VFAPFTLTALERPGSHVVFSSADFPGTISDHIVVTPELIADRPGDVQALVDAWYDTLAYIDEHPDEALEIMAGVADLSAEDYQGFAEGTTIFSAEEAAAAFEDGEDTTSLLFTARLINPFLVKAGLAEEEAPIDGLFDASFTKAHVAGSGG
jgi:NitT/TauT family transport system substrate-binding protein